MRQTLVSLIGLSILHSGLRKRVWTSTGLTRTGWIWEYLDWPVIYFATNLDDERVSVIACGRYSFGRSQQ